VLVGGNVGYLALSFHFSRSEDSVKAKMGRRRNTQNGKKASENAFFRPLLRSFSQSLGGGKSPWLRKSCCKKKNETHTTERKKTKSRKDGNTPSGTKEGAKTKAMTLEGSFLLFSVSCELSKLTFFSPFFRSNLFSFCFIFFSSICTNLQAALSRISLP